MADATEVVAEADATEVVIVDALRLLAALKAAATWIRRKVKAQQFARRLGDRA